MITRYGVLSVDDRPLSVEIRDITHRVGENPIFKVEVLSPFEKPDLSPFKRYMESKKGIKEVIFNDPATIVMWCDGTKTVVKCQPGDEYNKETGLAMCIAKKYLGNKGNFNEVFKKYIEGYDPREV